MNTTAGSYPAWLKKKAPHASVLAEMKTLVDRLSLHTICQSAMCPNQGECFSERTATLLVMGDVCTRRCRFCAVVKGRPSPLDPAEPRNVAEAVSIMHLKYAVITSVTRDDLQDGGAGHFARVISTVRQSNPQTGVEVLVPDFQGSPQALEAIVACLPEVIGHNVETVPRLYHEIRPAANYQRSLDLLRAVKSLNDSVSTKSGLMLGLGEEKEEVTVVMRDLRDAGCDILTLGQYMPPSSQHAPVARYVAPEEFDTYRSLAADMGFRAVASGPFVRSSFNARELHRISR